MEVQQFLTYIVITIVTHTKQPQIHLQFLSSDTARLKVNWISQILRFGGPLMWPGNVSIDHAGIVTFEFHKKSVGMWKFGYTLLAPDAGLSPVVPRSWRVVVVENKFLSIDTSALTFRHVDPVFNTVECGRWINVHKQIFGTTRSRYYFIIPKIPIMSLHEPNRGIEKKVPTDREITIMIKKLSEHSISAWLYERVAGDYIRISKEDGYFSLDLIRNRTKVYLISGGIGVAPMTSIALRILQTTNETKVHLIDFIFDQSRLIFYTYFTRLKEIDSRFNVSYIVQKEDPNWIGSVGFVDAVYLRSIRVPTFQEEGYNVFFVLSGAFHMILKTKRVLEKTFGYPSTSIFDYLGK